jgi:CBS domain containing-hemolysin-like protein
MSPALGIPILILAIAAYAVVNSIEIAVVGANRLRVRHLAESGSRSAEALSRLQLRPERFFAAIVVLQNISVVAASAVSSLVAVEIAGGWGVVAATILVAFGTALFGELTPKVLAARASERFALIVALPAEALTRILAPLVAALGYLPDRLSRALFGVSLEPGHDVSEAELRMLIGMSAETGSVNEEEANLLDRVFHFGDRQVHEVMVPRTEVVWLNKGTTVQEFYEVFTQASHSRFPMYEENQDHVLGVVGIKDVMRAVALGEMALDSDVGAVLRPPYYVPESKAIGELFREMQAQGIQMAIAVDEWGGTAGIVTLELLLEEMVGPMWDELAPAEAEIQPIDEMTVQVDGSLSVEEARENLGLSIEEGPYDTLAGFVLSEMGRIPREGEVIEIDGRTITVVEMQGQKIETLRVSR